MPLRSAASERERQREAQPTEVALEVTPAEGDCELGQLDANRPLIHLGQYAVQVRWRRGDHVHHGREAVTRVREEEEHGVLLRAPIGLRRGRGLGLCGYLPAAALQLATTSRPRGRAF